MANIEIEKKSSSRWWAWALLVLGVLALFYWLLLGDGTGGEPSSVPVVSEVADEPTAMSSDTGSAITDISTLTDGDASSLVGREVNLSNVPVGQVVGDASFWVIGPDGKQVYVVLNEVRTPDTPIEGRVDINGGDRVNLSGTLRSASDGAPEGAAIGSTTDQLPTGVSQFIYAQSAEVLG